MTGSSFTEESLDELSDEPFEESLEPSEELFDELSDALSEELLDELVEPMELLELLEALPVPPKQAGKAMATPKLSARSSPVSRLSFCFIMLSFCVYIAWCFKTQYNNIITP